MVEIDNEHFEKIISLTENYILNSKYYKIEEIDKLVKEKNEEIEAKRSWQAEAELKVRRLQIYDINNSINKYLELY